MLGQFQNPSTGVAHELFLYTLLFDFTDTNVTADHTITRNKALPSFFGNRQVVNPEIWFLATRAPSVLRKIFEIVLRPATSAAIRLCHSLNTQRLS